MDLINFKEFIDSKIVERGLDYYLENRVTSLTEVEENHYAALIEGSERYSVEIWLSSNGEIIDADCDCPYDWSEYCKHQVAVFYALTNDSIERKNGKQKENSTKEIKRGLSDILAIQNKDELITIINNMTQQYPELERQLYVKYGSASEEITESKRLVREYTNKAKHKGFIAWDKAGYAMEGAWIVLKNAREKAQAHDVAGAVALCIAVLTVVVETIQYCDDSNGEVGTVIYESLTTMEEVIRNNEAKLDKKMQKRLFDMIMKEAFNQRYEGWDEWRFILLRICSYFCGISDLRKSLENRLDDLLKASEDNDYHRNYKILEIKLIQYSIINNFDGQEKAESFIEANLEYSEFREMAITKALKVKDYEKVLQLCVGGEELNSEHAGLVSKWQKYRFVAYQELGDIQNQRKLAINFVLQNDFEYYKHLKELYPANEWSQQLENLLAVFEKQPYQREVYVNILIEEGLDSRLLEYCKRNISQIERLSPYLTEKYPEEVNQLFAKFINQEAKIACNRNNYRKVCAIIKNYKNACGNTPAHKIINELKESYPRRTAFLDELNRFR